MMLHNCQEQFIWSLLSLLRVQWIKVLSENYFPQMYISLNINSDDLWSYMLRQSLMFSSELFWIDLSSQHSEEWHLLNEIQEVALEVWKSCGLKILIKHWFVLLSTVFSFSVYFSFTRAGSKPIFCQNFPQPYEIRKDPSAGHALFSLQMHRVAI